MRAYHIHSAYKQTTGTNVLTVITQVLALFPEVVMPYGHRDGWADVGMTRGL